eukprot:gene24325-30648_t
MLVDCGLKVKKFDLEELAEHLLGRIGYYFALVFMFLFAYGGQIAYLVIIGDTVPLVADSLFPGTILSNRTSALLLISTLIVLPLCLLRDFSSLAGTSLVSIGAMVAFIVIVVVVAPSASSHQERHFTSSNINDFNASLFAGVGTMSFAFICTHNSFIVFRSLRVRTMRTWTKVTHMSILVSFALCASFGLIGFFCFYPYVEGDLMNNLPSETNVSVCVARALLALTMVLTYPMECVVSTHCLLSLLARWKQHRHFQLSPRVTASAAAAAAGEEGSPTASHSHKRRAEGSVLSLFAAATGSRMFSFQRIRGYEDRSTHSSLGGGSRHGGSSHDEGEGEEDLTTIDLAYSSAESGDRGEGVEMTSVGGRGEDEMETIFDEIELGDAPLKGGDGVINFSEVVLTGSGQRRGGTSSSSSSRSVQAVATDNPIRFDDLDDSSNITSDSSSSSSSSHQNVHEHSGESAAAVPPPYSYKEQVAVTLCLWTSTLAIALVFRELGVVSALTGAVAASMIGYVLPSLLYLKAYEEERRTAWRTAMDAVLRGVGDDADAVNRGVTRSNWVAVRCRRWFRAVCAVSDFVLPCVMVTFGVATLLIGVTTVLVNAS